MANFDYQIHPVIGRLNISEYTGYGKIKVYGYMDDGSFVRLSTSDARSIFGPNGKVFASKTIQRDYYNLNNAIVMFYVTPNMNEEGDDFVWNYDYPIVSGGTNIVKIQARLGQDGEKNYNVLTNEGLLEKEKDVFVHSGDKLYFIKSGSDTRIIPFSSYDDSLPIVGGYPDYFYIGNELPEPEGYIDITNDEQLIDWFLRIAKTDWSDIQSGTGESSLGNAREALLSMKNLPVIIAISRVNRLQSIVGSFVVTRDSLHSVAQSPWFKPTIESAVNRYRDDYVGKVAKDYQQELRELEESHKKAVEEEKKKHERNLASLRDSSKQLEGQYKNKIDVLNGHISEAQSELEQLVSEIGQKRQELKEYEEELDGILERKDEIINDFKIVHKVLGLSAKAETPEDHPQVSINLTSTNYSEKRMPFYKVFAKNLNNCLDLSINVDSVSISELAKLHARYGVLLLPNADVAMAFVAAAGRACYHVAYVSVAWKSFNDLWIAGLQKIVAHCAEEPEMVHYFVLRNINLSCLSNYLQPLADMMAGYSDTFPNTVIKFPDNLRILLTVSDDDLIPLSEGIIKYFGCVPKSIETKKHGRISYAKSTCYGYLDTSLLVEASKEMEEPNNYFVEYVDE